MFSSLRIKLIFFVGLPILLVNISLLMLSASQQQKAAMQQAENISRTITREYSNELQSLLDSALGSAKQTASVFQNINSSDNHLKIRQESANLILKGMFSKSEKFTGVFSVWEPNALASQDERFIAYWESGNQGEPTSEAMGQKEINEENGWYQTLRRNPQHSLAWNPTSTVSGNSNGVFRALAPIVDDGQFLGVVGIDIGADVLETILTARKNPQQGTIVHLHTITGNLIASSLDEGTAPCEFTENHPPPQGVYWQHDKLVSRQAFGSSLAQSNLILIMETSRNNILGPVQKQVRRNAFFGFGLVVVVLCFVGLFLRENMMRMARLGHFTRQVTLGKKIEEDIDESPDEIGELFRDFKTMLDFQQDAEREQRESLTRLQIILDSIQAGVVIIDAVEKRIVDANGTALKMLGMTKEQVLNRHCHGFICPPEIIDCPAQKMGHRSDEQQMELVRNDGSKLIIFKTAVPLVLKGKSYLLETFVDVDQQVKAEQELSEKLTQISHGKQQQDIIISHSVSREERMVALKTEVNDLRSQLGMPQRYKAPGEIEELLHEMAGDQEWGT